MSRKIIAIIFLILSISSSLFASFKVRNICYIATEEIEEIITLCESDPASAKPRVQSVYEFWQKNTTLLKLLVGTEETLNVRLSIYEMLFLLEQNNIEDFLEEASFCKRKLMYISEYTTFTLA